VDKQQLLTQMDGAVKIFSDDITTIRTGRVSPALIENLEVLVYSGAQKLRLLELGSISVEGGRNLVFQPWDKTIIGEIKNGIMQSGQGFNPIVDNDKIRIAMPAPTTEQRENFVKLLYKKLEAAKNIIRDIRGKLRYELQDKLRSKDLSEDQFKIEEESLQKTTDDYIAKVEEMGKRKETEIRET